MRRLLKRLTGIFLAFLLTGALMACTSSKESVIKCSKCGASPAELQKQYEDKTKNN